MIAVPRVPLCFGLTIWKPTKGRLKKNTNKQKNTRSPSHDPQISPCYPWMKWQNGGAPRRADCRVCNRGKRKREQGATGEKEEERSESREARGHRGTWFRCVCACVHALQNSQAQGQ